MNRFTDMLSDAVLSKKSSACSLDELQSLLEKHPYASALQLLYAKKLKEAKDDRYPKQLQRTLLYYRNPVLINHLIETDDQSSVLNNTVKHIQDDTVSEKTSSKDVSDLELTSESLLHDNIPEPENDALHIKKPDNIQLNEKDHIHIEAEPDIEAAILENDIEAETTDNEEALPELPQFKIEAIDPAKAELAFTPYFTVDYFAAQGIKLADQSTNDRFGTQLKSFTAWLKQMKRLPGVNVKAITGITATEEKNIEKMAQHSLTGENADTEAMAEVWAKQGNVKKAIEIYKKLSLQIPRKSAYFAAKIDHLKK